MVALVAFSEAQESTTAGVIKEDSSATATAAYGLPAPCPPHP